MQRHEEKSFSYRKKHGEALTALEKIQNKRPITETEDMWLRVLFKHLVDKRSFTMSYDSFKSKTDIAGEAGKLLTQLDQELVPTPAISPPASKSDEILFQELSDALSHGNIVQAREACAAIQNCVNKADFINRPYLNERTLLGNLMTNRKIRSELEWGEIISSLLAAGADPCIRFLIIDADAAGGMNEVNALHMIYAKYNQTLNWHTDIYRRGELDEKVFSPEIQLAYLRIFLKFKKGIDASQTTDRRGSTPIEYLILDCNTHTKHHVVSALRIFAEANMNMNFQNSYGDTMLHLAARTKNATMVQFLCDLSVNLEIQNRQGETPINVIEDATCARILIKAGAKHTLVHVAGRCEDQTLLEEALDAKEDINAQNHHGDSILHLLIKKHDSIKILNSNIRHRESMEKRNLDFVKLVLTKLKDNRILCLKNKEGQTILHIIAPKYNSEMIETLCAHIAKLALTEPDLAKEILETTNSEKRTALHVAQDFKCDVNTARNQIGLLIETSKKVDASLECTDMNGLTVLQKAINRNSEEIVCFLMDNGFDANETVLHNEEYMTEFEYAEQMNPQLCSRLNIEDYCKGIRLAEALATFGITRGGHGVRNGGVLQVIAEYADLPLQKTPSRWGGL